MNQRFAEDKWLCIRLYLVFPEDSHQKIHRCNSYLFSALQSSQVLGDSGKVWKKNCWYLETNWISGFCQGGATQSYEPDVELHEDERRSQHFNKQLVTPHKHCEEVLKRDQDSKIMFF